VLFVDEDTGCFGRRGGSEAARHGLRRDVGIASGPVGEQRVRGTKGGRVQVESTAARRGAD
jgi:hypothetical protein